MTEKSAQGQVFITSVPLSQGGEFISFMIGDDGGGRPLDCQQDDGLVKRATALDVVHQ